MAQALAQLAGDKATFEFLEIGDLPLDTPERFTEDTPYRPSSPYSASKASSDHLVQWVAPDPGKWLSLTLEGVLALVLVLVAIAVFLMVRLVPGDPARLAAMRAIKAALDPMGIMNPGAVLG